MADLLGKHERVLDGVRRVAIGELNAAAKSLRDSLPRVKNEFTPPAKASRRCALFWRRSMLPEAAALRAADSDCVR
jgi:hypothetical protein